MVIACAARACVEFFFSSSSSAFASSRRARVAGAGGTAVGVVRLYSTLLTYVIVYGRVAGLMFTLQFSRSHLNASLASSSVDAAVYREFSSYGVPYSLNSSLARSTSA